MYRHILALIDCSDDARREALQIVRQFASEPTIRITIAASMTPAPSPEIRQKKVEHAQSALRTIGDLILREGIYTRRRLLEAEDVVDAVLAEVAKRSEGYDLIVLGAHQTQVEFDDQPCRGSLADRIAQRSPLPVMILPEPR
jgi:Universal stress protein UspA and related nucleotide-binding proteins